MSALACRPCYANWTSTAAGWRSWTMNSPLEALSDPMVARLTTIPGVDAIASISIVAAVGTFPL